MNPIIIKEQNKAFRPIFRNDKFSGKRIFLPPLINIKDSLILIISGIVYLYIRKTRENIENNLNYFYRARPKIFLISGFI